MNFYFGFVKTDDKGSSPRGPTVTRGYLLHVVSITSDWSAESIRSALMSETSAMERLI